jgi:ribonuclease Z
MTAKTLALAGACGVSALLVLAGLARGVALHMSAVQRMLVARGFHETMERNAAMAALVDAPVLRVVLCGTGSPLPSRERAGPCAAILAGGHIWLVDAGGGGWRNMQLWHMPTDKLTAVLLTHFHSDHIEDLGEVNLQSWVSGRTSPLDVYGGPGVDRVVGGFNAAYALDSEYRETHHGAKVLPFDAHLMAARVVEAGGGAALHEGQVQTVLDRDGMRITAIGVNHAPVSPAYAYRFDYGGRSVVVSGDTKASPAFATAVAGVEVMVHEAQSEAVVAQLHDLMAAEGNNRMAKLLNDIQSYHTSPEQAAGIANAAGAKLLVLTHLTPALPGFLSEPVFMDEVAQKRPGGSVLGRDGMMISLPGGGTAVDISQLQ